jgi:hypothetical protein
MVPQKYLEFISLEEWEKVRERYSKRKREK